MGYCRDAALLNYAAPASPDPAAARYKIGRWCADDTLCKAADPSKLAFRNMIDVMDAAALPRSGADFLVLHKYFMALKIMTDAGEAGPSYGSVPVYYRSAALLAVQFKTTLGMPVYEDSEIVCFPIKRAKP